MVQIHLAKDMLKNAIIKSNNSQLIGIHMVNVQDIYVMNKWLNMQTLVFVFGIINHVVLNI